ncbi:MAG TPA: DUF302 domain-containing protein [Bellilinea sp.]|jgi:uncharacterized protein (DUF302 family)|nr:hypothetical protein [Anaerolineaceae bacterium]HML39344.1 DUF302 domain-containing protein [Bellilinea sp.]
MEKFDYTVETTKNVDEAVAAVEAKAQEKGFRVLYVHDVQATLSAKGFDIEPMKIIEICNAKFANQALAKDKKISLMLPCPISVFTEEGKTYITAFKPRVLSDFYPGLGIEELAGEVEKIVISLVEEAR